MLLVIVDEKEEVSDELDMNCGGITPTSLGSDKFFVVNVLYYILDMVGHQTYVSHAVVIFSPM